LNSGIRHLVREALTWTCGALLLVLAIYYSEDIASLITDGQSDIRREFAIDEPDPEPAPASPGMSGTVRIQPDRNGHYSTDAVINGRILPVMVDTGASMVVLSYEAAERAGLRPHSLDFSGRASTANGVSKIAPVRLDRVRVGGIMLRDIPAAVAEPGVLRQNLLGMTFLRKLKRFQIENQQLILTR